MIKKDLTAIKKDLTAALAALAVNAGVDNGSGTRFEGYHIAQVLTGGEIVIAPDFLSGAVPVAVCVNKQKLLATLRQVVRYGNKNAGHRSGYDGLEMLVPGVSGTLCQEHALAEVKAFSKQVMSQLGAPRLVTMEMVKALASAAGVNTENPAQLRDAIVRRVARGLIASHLSEQ